MSILMMVIAGIAGISVLGIVLFLRNTAKGLKKKEFERNERAVLQQVLASDGKVTPLAIAANIDQSFEEVKATLDRLCTHGFGHLDVTDSGALSYIFEQTQVSDALSPAQTMPLPHPVIKTGKVPKGILQAEYDTLVAFYHATGGPDWKKQDGWLKSKKLDKWHGLKLENGRVVSLYLGSNNLYGSLPDLSALTELQKLSLPGNKLSGPLPNFDNLSKLRIFYLHNNEFGGSVPNFAKAARLEHIDIAYNRLQGPLPDFKELLQLREIRLSVNELEGPLPNFTHLKNLQSLSLFNNRFFGEIPDFKGLRQLRNLRLDNNQFSGSIPEFPDLVQLKNLQLQENQLDGTLPKLKNLTQLEDFAAHENALEGSIPDYSHLRRLTMLKLRTNLLTGPIPDLSQNINLDHIYLNDNQLSGPFPPLYRLPRLRWLDIGNNFLSGPVPALGPSNVLEYLNIQKNQLSGPIPLPDNLPRLKPQNLKLSDNPLCRAVGIDYGKYTDTLKDFPECPHDTETETPAELKRETLPKNPAADIKTGLDGIASRFPKTLAASSQLSSNFKIIASAYKNWLPNLVDRLDKLTENSDEDTLQRFKPVILEELAKYREHKRKSQFPDGEETDMQFQARMILKFSSGPMRKHKMFNTKNCMKNSLSPHLHRSTFQ
ncbi:hypothetical protein QUF90_03195 [Desulfococcaceae bacterium HSG9]|nr:hypothetical protein [Desulfococcaceae bacterium HSG9]